MEEETLAKSPLPIQEGLFSLKGVLPFSMPPPNSSYLKTGGSLHCISPSLGLTPSAPDFPGLGWEAIQSGLCRMTSPRGPPAEWFLIRIPAPSSRPPGSPKRQHPKRQMPERVSRGLACAGGGGGGVGGGSQEDNVSVCPSVWPLTCGPLPVFCALKCLENIFLSFLPVSQSVKSSESSGQFSRGWGGGGSSMWIFPLFESLPQISLAWIKVSLHSPGPCLPSQTAFGLNFITPHFSLLCFPHLPFSAFQDL